jgi:hypothetical protein
MFMKNILCSLIESNKKWTNKDEQLVSNFFFLIKVLFFLWFWTTARCWKEGLIFQMEWLKHIQKINQQLTFWLMTLTSLYLIIIKKLWEQSHIFLPWVPCYIQNFLAGFYSQWLNKKAWTSGLTSLLSKDPSHTTHTKQENLHFKMSQVPHVLRTFYLIHLLFLKSCSCITFLFATLFESHIWLT